MTGVQTCALPISSVIKLVNELLMEALEQQSSDVHIEPQENGLIIRYRVDGLLRVQPVPESIMHFYAAIVTRLKIMSKLNIAEKRIPQDGRIKLKISGREIDVRVSIIPMIYGEGVVATVRDLLTVGTLPWQGAISRTQSSGGLDSSTVRKSLTVAT